MSTSASTASRVERLGIGAVAERLEVVLAAEVAHQHEALLGVHGDHRRHVHAGRGEDARDAQPRRRGPRARAARPSRSACRRRDARGSSAGSSRRRTRARCARRPGPAGPRSIVPVCAAADRRCRSLSCRGDGRGARIIDFPTPVISRRIIALLATTGVLPPAAASECLWPGVPRSPPPAASPRPRPTPRTRTSSRSRCESGNAEMTREGDAKLSGGVTILQGEREVSADAADLRRVGAALRGRGRRRVPLARPAPEGRLRQLERARHGPVHRRGIRAAAAARRAVRPRRSRWTTQGELKLSDVRFTTCPAGNTDWELRASSIEIDQKTQQGKGRNVRVDLKGVPILYTPVISFPGRRRAQVRLPVPVVRQLRQERLRDRRAVLLQPRAELRPDADALPALAPRLRPRHRTTAT